MIMRQLKDMQQSMQREVQAIKQENSTNYGKVLGHIATHEERIDNLERFVNELRSNAIDSRELSQSLREVKDELRHYRQTMDKTLLNDIDQERAMGGIREQLARRATEAGAEAGAEAVAKGKTRQTLISTVVAGVVAGALMGGAQACERLKEPARPAATTTAHP